MDSCYNAMMNTPEECAAACNEFLKRFPKAERGPAHIVLSDFNFEDFWIQSCIEQIDSRPTTDELMATKAFLLRLLEVPESNRCYCHGEYFDSLPDP